MMDFILKANICFSDVPKTKLSKGKNNKLYGNIIITPLKEPDQFGNTCSVYMSQTKDERQNKEKRVFIGNATFIKEPTLVDDQPEQPYASSKPDNSDDDGLPF